MGESKAKAQMKRVMVFNEVGDFAATKAAERVLTAAGFSVGRSERGAPRGLLLGDFDIQRWRNLNKAERDALHGQVTGDGRNGPIFIHLSSCAPEAAWEALSETTALS